MDDYDVYYDAMQEEQALQDAMQDAYFEGEISTNPMLDLITSENWEHYRDLLELMKNKQFLNLTIGLNSGVPYYKTELQGRQKNIYITKEIRRQVYNYLIKDIIPAEMPEVYEAYNKMDESFILHHLKTDRKNKVTRYKEEAKEYYAKYPNGTINYGQLPYTTEELINKLEALQ